MPAPRPQHPTGTPSRRRTPCSASCSASTSSSAWSARCSCPSWTATRRTILLSRHTSWPTDSASRRGSTGAPTRLTALRARLTPLAQSGVRAALIRVPPAPCWPSAPVGSRLALQARRIPRLPRCARPRLRTLRMALLRRHLARHQPPNGPLHPLLPALLAWHGTRRVRCAHASSPNRTLPRLTGPAPAFLPSTFAMCALMASLALHLRGRVVPGVRPSQPPTAITPSSHSLPARSSSLPPRPSSSAGPSPAPSS